VESAFAWLNAIFNYFGQFVPKFYHVKWTERAVRYRRGNFPTEVGPGVRWYFPLTSHVEKAEVVWSVQEFKPTTLTTRDNHTMSVGYTMMYRVTDIVTTHTSTDNFLNSLGELAELPLADIWHSHQRDELREMAALKPGARRSELDRMLTRRARALCSFLGVRIKYCRVNFDANARVIKLLQEDFT
jgi:regulator of protease activity HflC (stomatin/prohibitin superfamily)